MNSKLPILVLVLLVVVAASVWYLQTSNLHISAGNSNGAIFTVATSTGATYLTVMANGDVGIDTDDPDAPLQVAGPIRLTTQSTAGCYPSTEGEIAYNPTNKHFWGCNGSSWDQLDN